MESAWDRSRGVLVASSSPSPRRPLLRPVAAPELLLVLPPVGVGLLDPSAAISNIRTGLSRARKRDSFRSSCPLRSEPSRADLIRSDPGPLPTIMRPATLFRDFPTTQLAPLPPLLSPTQGTFLHFRLLLARPTRSRMSSKSLLENLALSRRPLEPPSRWLPTCCLSRAGFVASEFEFLKLVV